MAMKLVLSSPGQFKMLGEETNLAQKWDQYVKRFEYYIKAQNVTKDEQKRPLLLHVAGEEVQDLFETLQDTDTTYAEALGALHTYFEPKKSIAFERHLFRQAKQQDDKTVDNFIVRLSKLSLGCDFKDEAQKNDMIRDQMVDCRKSTELRKKLLSESELTLDKIRTVSRTFELSRPHAKKMAEDNQTLDTKSGEINRLNGARRKQPGPRNSNGNDATSGNQRQMGHHSDRSNHSGYSKASQGKAGKRHTRATAECYRCGGKGHYGRECQRAKNVICRDSGRRGHFARICKTQVKNANVIDYENVTEDYQCGKNEEIFVLGKQDATVSLSISGKQIDI